MACNFEGGNSKTSRSTMLHVKACTILALAYRKRLLLYKQEIKHHPCHFFLLLQVHLLPQCLPAGTRDIYWIGGCSTSGSSDSKPLVPLQVQLPSNETLSPKITLQSARDTFELDSTIVTEWVNADWEHNTFRGQS